MPTIVHVQGGHLIRGATIDFSEGGAALALTAMPDLAPNDLIHVSLWRGEEEFLFPARVVAAAGSQLRLRWELTDAEQQAALVQCTFARADAWASWAKGRGDDAVLAGLGQVLSVGLGGYRRIAEKALPAQTHKLRRASIVLSWAASLMPRSPRSPRSL
jgi:cellulose synthase (UDP-forming)